MNRQDRFGSLGDGACDQVDIDVARLGIDIDEHRLGAGLRNRFAGGDKGIGNGDDFVVGTDAGGQHGEAQGVCAGIDRHAVPAFTKCAEFLLQAVNVRPSDESAVCQDLIEHGTQLSLYFPILGF